jgi:segregation and condensation protein A
LLELIKNSLVELVQTEAFAPIHVRARAEVLEEVSIDADDEVTDG